MSDAGRPRAFVGQVVKRPFAVGSKSEHQAVCLVEASGRSLRLRRVGGTPYADEQLERLVGKRIRGEGKVLAGNTVLLSNWTELDEEGSAD